MCYEEGTAGKNFARQKFLLLAVKYVYWAIREQTQAAENSFIIHVSWNQRVTKNHGSGPVLF